MRGEVVDFWLGDGGGTPSTIELALVKKSVVLRLVVAVSRGRRFSELWKRSAGGGMFGGLASSLWLAVVVLVDRLPPQRLYLWHTAVVQAGERIAIV